MSSPTVPNPAAPTRAPWWERGADWLNAILVKEARQALKSRQFVMTFLLLLLAAWAVSTFGVLLSGKEVEYGNVGRNFFYSYYIVLAVATVLIIPFGAHRSLLAERDHNTFDLLSITTLSPGKIVRGKLWSALLQLFIFYSAITPFMAFASLMNGFDAPTAAFVLVASLLGSALLSMAGLMFATLSRQRVWQGLLSMMVLGGLGLALAFTLWLVGVAVHQERIPFEDREFWLFIGLIVLLALSYFVLFQQITIAQLTFESGNRSTGIRLTAGAQFLLVWGILIGIGLYERARRGSGVPDDALLSWSVVCGIHWAVFGLFAATESETLSHRVARDLPRNRFPRTLLIPFLPGGARGLIWLLLNVALLWLLTIAVHGGMTNAPTGPGAAHVASGAGVAWTEHARWILAGAGDEFLKTLRLRPSFWSRPVQFTAGLCCYLILYVGGGAALGRWLRRRATDLQPSHVRVVAFLALAAGMIAPLLPNLFNHQSQDRLLDLTSPVGMLNRIQDGRISDFEWGLLLGTTALVVLANGRGLARAVNEVWQAGSRRA